MNNGHRTRSKDTTPEEYRELVRLKGERRQRANEEQRKKRK